MFSPGGLFTLTLDLDHQKFRNNEEALPQSDFLANNSLIATAGDKAVRTTNFIPDTDRLTGTARIHSRIGDRAVVHGGFQISKLEQVVDTTPLQDRATPLLGDNKIVTYSANLASNVRISRAFSANTFFKFNLRNNKIDRSTDLFGPTNGKQFDEFLDRFWRITTGAEPTFRPRSGQLYAGGAAGSGSTAIATSPIRERPTPCFPATRWSRTIARGMRCISARACVRWPGSSSRERSAT